LTFPMNSFLPIKDQTFPLKYAFKLDKEGVKDTDFYIFLPPLYCSKVILRRSERVEEKWRDLVFLLLLFISICKSWFPIFLSTVDRLL
jgi:hypothetical protein